MSTDAAKRQWELENKIEDLADDKIYQGDKEREAREDKERGWKQEYFLVLLKPPLLQESTHVSHRFTQNSHACSGGPASRWWLFH